MASLSDALKLLPSLKTADLKQIKARVDALLKLTPAEKNDDNWIALGIVCEMRRRGLLSEATAHRCYKMSDSIFLAKSGDVWDLLMSSVGAELKAAEKLLLGRIAARVLADLLVESQSGLSVQRMFWNVDRIPEAIEAGFPGYLESGMLRMLVR